ncbi:MAG: hypothetical protein PV358_14790 [Acidimicrobiales bacterium]|nr:hypothetical protein [Acidimicrobiales bacterium]
MTRVTSTWELVGCYTAGLTEGTGSAGGAPTGAGTVVAGAGDGSAAGSVR